MIIGVGIDIAELDRIQRSLERFGDKFCARILTSDEQSRMPANAVPYVASRFAAKEAAVKALGTGFSQGITFLDIEVRSDALGKPGIVFHGEARRRADEMAVCAVHLSLTHGRDSAVAVVILETFPTS